MSKIEISIGLDESTTQWISGLIAALSGGSVTVPEKAEEAKTPAPKKTKKAAPKKEEKEPEADADEDEEEAEEKPAKKGKKAASKKSSGKKGKVMKPEEGPSLTDVRKTFAKLLDVLEPDEGQKEGKKLLKKYNAKNMDGIDPDNYGNIIEDAEKIIAAAEADEDEDDDDLDLDFDEDDDDE